MQNLRITQKRTFVDTWGTGDSQSIISHEVRRDYLPIETDHKTIKYSQQVLDNGVVIETFNAEENAILFISALNTKFNLTPTESAKHFPNGFNSYIETHFEIAGEICFDVNRDPQSILIEKVQNEKGRGGLYELAEELTDEFEASHKGREWDGEYYDEVEKFIESKFNT